MQIRSVRDDSFRRYGKVLEGYDFSQLLRALAEATDKPGDHTIYVHADAYLQSLPIYRQLTSSLFGGMPIQIGYCNGSNTKLNCLEYHRGSEVNVFADDAVLLLAPIQSLQEGSIDSAEVEAFAVEQGQAVLLYETTLHYAPCNAVGGDGFRAAVILPKDTNTKRPEIAPCNPDDELLWANNKWLIAHPETSEAGMGAHVGISGPNITVQ